MFDYAIVSFLGALVALGELVSRYRDSPRRALLGSFAAWLYCLINSLASVSALGLMHAFDVTFGQKRRRPPMDPHLGRRFRIRDLFPKFHFHGACRRPGLRRGASQLPSNDSGRR